MTSKFTNPHSTPQPTTPHERERSAVPLEEEWAYAERVTAFHDGLSDALAAGDVPALQVLVPHLTEAEADALIEHAAPQKKLRDVGFYNYGAHAWPEEVPVVVMVATIAVRRAALEVRRPDLSQEDAHAILRENIEHELAWGEFWRWPIHRLHIRDLRSADALRREQEQAQLAAALHLHRKALGKAYCAARYFLREAEVPFELLAAYAQRRKA